MEERSIVHIVIACAVALMIVALIAYARGEEGDDGRTDDVENVGLPALVGG